MRLICPECGVLDEVPDHTCLKCGIKAHIPTIFDCAKLGLLAEFQELVSKEQITDINCLDDETNATVLHHAAINNRIKLLEYIMEDAALRKQVDFEVLGGQLQTTPLFWATFHNHIYVVELLLRHGANAGFTDVVGFNPFLLAVQRGFPILAAYYIAKGTDVNVRLKDASTRTALMLICDKTRFHLDSFRMLLSLNADIHAQDLHGNTALHYAAKHDISIAVRMLLDKGAESSVVNDRNECPLDLATSLGGKTTKRILKEHLDLEKLSKTTGISKKFLQIHLHKLSFVVPWIFIPSFAWIMHSTDGAFQIVLKLVVLFAVSYFVLHIAQLGMYADKKKMSSLLFGVNVASIVWLVTAFPFFLESDRNFFQMFMTIALSGLVYCLYKTATIDPGVIESNYELRLQSIKNLVEMKSRSATKLCLTCLHRRPIRSKHCAELNVCITKFDHYCPYVANAIGEKNHHYFLSFLFFAVVAIGLELTAFWSFLTSSKEVVWNGQVSSYLWQVLHYHPVFGSASCLAIVHIAWIGYLMFFHIYLAVEGLTTNEFVKNQNMSRLFSRGGLRNLVDFFHLPGAVSMDWQNVFELRDFEAFAKKQILKGTLKGEKDN